jgi:vacuolar-type H+-ATPase subunit F/Vma7
MVLCAFIGDPLTATGFRLAGARVHLVPPGDGTALFRRLRDQADLLILTAAVAATLPDWVLHDAQAASRPLLLVVPDAAARHPAEDLAAKLRTQLGMSE